MGIFSLCRCMRMRNWLQSYDATLAIRNNLWAPKRKKSANIDRIHKILQNHGHKSQRWGRFWCSTSCMEILDMDIEPTGISSLHLPQPGNFVTERNTTAHLVSIRNPCAWTRSPRIWFSSIEQKMTVVSIGTTIMLESICTKYYLDLMICRKRMR